MDTKVVADEMSSLRIKSIHAPYSLGSNAPTQLQWRKLLSVKERGHNLDWIRFKFLFDHKPVVLGRKLDHLVLDGSDAGEHSHLLLLTLTSYFSSAEYQRSMSLGILDS